MLIMIQSCRFGVAALVLFVFLIGSGGSSLGEEKKLSQKRKIFPMLVSTVEVQEGNIQPMDEFIGTTAFSRVSHVATDIGGLVREINFEVGQTIDEGDQLAVLDSELLDIDIVGTRASFEQNQIELKSAERDLKRISTLYNDKAVSEIDHDEYITKMKRLEKLSIVLESKLNNLLAVKRKKSLPAPFSGIVLEKKTEVGEWLAKGGKVAVVADSNRIDILVNISADMLEYLEKGREVPVKIGNRELTGVFYTFIPAGDITTRTFTAKFQLEKPAGIFGGLEALVMLPRIAMKSGLLVPRDSVVDRYGSTMVFTVIDKKAKEIPVQVVGYHGLQAMVAGSGLEKGQQVIVRGSKRVTDWLPVTVKR